MCVVDTPVVVDSESESSQLLWVALGGAAPIAVAAGLVSVRGHLLNANVALVLVLVVVLAAVGGGRTAGAVAAVSAALSFNFFHTVPYLTLEIDSADDVETTLLLLAVGLAVGQLSSVRRHPMRTGETLSEEIRRIHRVATVGEPGRHTSADMIMAAQVELSELLDLRSCQFEAFPFTQPLPRLERSGVISVMEYRGPDTGSPSQRMVPSSPSWGAATCRPLRARPPARTPPSPSNSGSSPWRSPTRSGLPRRLGPAAHLQP